MNFEQFNLSCIVLNIPHSGVYVPEEYRKGILLPEEDFNKELELVTDSDVDKIFVGYDRVVAEQSRLVCDMERFLNDEQEEMSKIGMGVVYTKTCSGKMLRNMDEEQRLEIINSVYLPYHKQLENKVSDKIKEYNKCLIVDCHSYSEKLPYITGGDVDICIGVDDYHTREKTWRLLFNILTDKGYKVDINKPFSGSIVPLKYYRIDKRVNSIMIEINKKLYRQAGESDSNKVMELSNMFISILPMLEKTV